MLCIRTKVQPSEVSGLGLFADENITKGTVIWKFEPRLDLLISKEDIEVMSKPAKEQIYNYAYLDRKYNKFLLCGDDARFFNHSIDCNCDDSNEDITIASRDIKKGEELTVNYSTFYGDSDLLSFIKN